MENNVKVNIIKLCHCKVSTSKLHLLPHFTYHVTERLINSLKALKAVKETLFTRCSLKNGGGKTLFKSIATGLKTIAMWRKG